MGTEWTGKEESRGSDGGFCGRGRAGARLWVTPTSYSVMNHGLRGGIEERGQVSGKCDELSFGHFACEFRNSADLPERMWK